MNKHKEVYQKNVTTISSHHCKFKPDNLLGNQLIYVINMIYSIVTVLLDPGDPTYLLSPSSCPVF